QRGGAGDRVAREGAAEAAGVRGVDDLGSADHRGQGQPGGERLGGGQQVGRRARCSTAHSRPVRPRPDRTSSATSTAPLRSATSRSARQYRGWSGTKPASPCTGSTTIAATAEGSTWATMALSRNCRAASTYCSSPSPAGRLYMLGKGRR